MKGLQLPSDVEAVFGVFLTREFNTLGKGGVPMAWPTLSMDWAERSQSILAGLVALAQKALTLGCRLWDIDVIIRRTLIYSVLTAVLALAYFGTVLVLESAFGALTGQGHNSFVVVLSTLTIAALFVPLRGRVQAGIDRRFLRRKYDAACTVAGFAPAARDEVDRDRLNTLLANVVDETMQPQSVGLWLRQLGHPRRPAHQPIRSKL